MNISKPKLKVGLIIPVFNVEKTITKVLDSISTDIIKNISEILFIDNHSTDKTLTIIRKAMDDYPTLPANVSVIMHKANYGYGCSVKAGLEYFVDRDVSHVMIIHGDHQVDPAWLMGKLIAEINAKPETDLVLASRFKSDSNIESYSPLRTFGNYFFNITTFLCTGHRMSDSGTGMIIVRRDALKKVSFTKLSNSWQFHPQLNILFYGIPKVRIEVISMDWADSEAASTVPLFRYGLILLKMLTMYWVKKNLFRKKPEYIFLAEPFPADRQFTVVSKALNQDVGLRS